MRDQVEAERVDAVIVREQGRRGLGHHDGRVDAGDQVREDRALPGRRRPQDRVQRRDRGDAEGLDEVEDVLAVVAAPGVVVELDGGGLDAGPERTPGGGVVGALVAPDPVVDLEREWRSPTGWEQDSDLAVTRRRRQVARERGDPTATRGVTGDEGSPCDDVGPLGRSEPHWSAAGRALGEPVLRRRFSGQPAIGSAAVPESDGAARPMGGPLDAG